MIRNWMTEMKKWNVGILIFNDVEVLDFAGPFEVFSRTRLVSGLESRRSEESAPFRVFTVAKTSTPVTTTGGLQVIPEFMFSNAPPIDLLVVPGGLERGPFFRIRRRLVGSNRLRQKQRR